MGNKFTCECGSTDFNMTLLAHDEVEYSVSVSENGDIDTISFEKDSCGETEYSQFFECNSCGKKHDRAELWPDEWRLENKDNLIRDASTDLLKTLKMLLSSYGRLHDMLSDAIEGGRLTESDIPDDYTAIVSQLSGPCIDANRAAVSTISKVIGE